MINCILVSRETRWEVVTYFINWYFICLWDWLTLQAVFNTLLTSSMLDFAFSSWGGIIISISSSLLICLGGSGGHGFDSCQGLGFFLRLMLVSCWSIHLLHFITELKIHHLYSLYMCCITNPRSCLVGESDLHSIIQLISYQIFLLMLDWSKHVTWPNIPNFQNCAHCENDLEDNKHNSLHLGWKYARIFVLEHHLFLEAHRFPHATCMLSENCSPLATDNVHGQIS